MDTIANQIISELHTFADPKRAEGERRYFKETINNLGISSTNMRAIEKKLYASYKKQWNVDQAIEFADVLLNKRIFETTQLALLFLDRFSSKMGESELIKFEEWLNADLCDNWAATDTLCPHVVGSILDNHPELVKRVRAWADSDNRWVRRSSAVSFIILLRRGKFLDDAYDIAQVLMQDKNDDLVQKANGWMLREAGNVDPDRLEKFLIQHGPNIPRTTVRYAIEKFPKEKRKELLIITK